MLVTKRELYELLGISHTTLNKWLQKHGDRFPVVERGTNGKEWQFDPEAVKAFLAADAADRAKARDDRAAWKQQFILPILDPDVAARRAADIVRVWPALMWATVDALGRELGLAPETIQILGGRLESVWKSHSDGKTGDGPAAIESVMSPSPILENAIPADRTE